MERNNSSYTGALSISKWMHLSFGALFGSKWLHHVLQRLGPRFRANLFLVRSHKCRPSQELRCAGGWVKSWTKPLLRINNLTDPFKSVRSQNGSKYPVTAEAGYKLRNAYCPRGGCGVTEEEFGGDAPSFRRNSTGDVAIAVRFSQTALTSQGIRTAESHHLLSWAYLPRSQEFCVSKILFSIPTFIEIKSPLLCCSSKCVNVNLWKNPDIMVMAFSV